MPPALYKLLFILIYSALGLLIVSCLLSAMHAFMGGTRDQADFSDLHALQSYGIGFAGFLCVLAVTLLGTFRGVAGGLRLAWEHVPGWMVFGAAMLVFLALMGELSYFLLRNSTLTDGEWVNHVALACLITSSLAVCLVYSVQHASSGRPGFSKERW